PGTTGGTGRVRPNSPACPLLLTSIGRFTSFQIDGAVAKWLRQRIANPPSWVQLPPAPLARGDPRFRGPFPFLACSLDERVRILGLGGAEDMTTFRQSNGEVMNFSSAVMGLPIRHVTESRRREGS